MTEEEREWDADARNARRSSSAGSMSAGTPEQVLSLADCLPSALMELVLTMREQNKVLWALVEQTAALIETLAGSQLEDEDSAEGTYLDGSPRIS